VQSNVNNLGFSGCNGASSTETLTGYDDWANILYDFRGTSDYADGVHVTKAVDEVTVEIVEEMRTYAPAYFDLYLPNITKTEMRPAHTW